jgi:hypothetical protein
LLFADLYCCDDLDPFDLVKLGKPRDRGFVGFEVAQFSILEFRAVSAKHHHVGPLGFTEIDCILSVF